MASIEYREGDAIPGTQYRFVGELGAGGHGAVYAVEHTFLEAPAVMKLLHANLVDRGDIAQRMTREARTLAKLRHPNIVEVRDGGITQEAAPRPFFVMESLNGMPLRDLLRHVRGGIGVLPALRILIGVLEGLEHAHRAGVVHRDIKPDNIYLHRTSTDVTVPKILDFGIAHLLLGQRTTGRFFLGTPRYAAPEQLRGETVSARTDIYATGLLLYELLTGQAPFAAFKEIGAIVNAHLNDDLPLVSSRCTDAPAYLDRFVASMVAKDPDERPPTAFAAAVGLREIRARLEADQAGSMHTPEFKTEPSPMDGILHEAGPHEVSLVTEAAGPREGNDTIPQAAPGFPTVRERGGARRDRAAGAQTERDPRPVARSTPSELDATPTPTASCPPNDMPPRAPRVDRAARTNTARPVAVRRRNGNDTEPMAEVHPALADTTPEEMPLHRRAVMLLDPRPAHEERTPGAIAFPLRPRPETREGDPHPSRRRRPAAWVVAAATLVGICAVGLPLALRSSKVKTASPAAVAPPDTPRQPAPATSIAAAQTSEFSAPVAAAQPSANPTPAPPSAQAASAPRAPSVAIAAASARPSMSAATAPAQRTPPASPASTARRSPAVKQAGPVDPSSIGFD